VLQPVPSGATVFSEENILRDSLGIKEQPDKRISQVWTYFAQVNPLEDQEDPSNYLSVAATIDGEAETDYGASSIAKIFSRWIAFGGRSIALNLNDIRLSQYRDPPRRFNRALPLRQ
jgi:hypothetical protein